MRHKLNILIPEEIKVIHNIFKNNGFFIHVVGGAVRDSILNIKPKDWDLVTDATPDTVISLLKGQNFVKNILETGKAFGVINVITNTDEFEIATARKDIGSGRRPDTVEFTTIEQDITRRDLSCNALFFDIDTNEVVDLVGGVEDIKNGVVRTVGNPADRFGEDRLRILRAVRFAGRFGSELDPAVEAALKKDNSLEGVSPERIRDEFLKGIKTAKNVPHFIGLISKFNLWDAIFPGLNVNKEISNIDKDPIVLLAELLKNNEASTLNKKLNKLTFSSEENKAITSLIFLQGFKDPSQAFKFKKMLDKSGLDETRILKFALRAKLNPTLIKAILDFKLSVTGQQVQDELGISPGPEMGAAIEKMENDNFLKVL